MNETTKLPTSPDLAQGLPLIWVAEQLNAEVLGELSGAAFGICTDTRLGAKGSLFFALQGETDGHRFVKAALEAGAVAAIVSRRIEGAPGTQLVVPDTTRALGDLAHAYRMLFDIPVIGITGSVGKTSTKEMIAAALSTQYRVLANEKNYNTEIGVPLTLFRLRREHEVAIVEMGMRGLGEIDWLAQIAAPTVGIVTNIGYAHIERLGSRENIAQAKAELLTHLPEGGTAILMESEFAPYLRDHVQAGTKIVMCAFGTNADAEVIGLNGDVSQPMQVRIAGESYAVPLKAVGTHHQANALLALATAHVLDVPLPAAIAALGEWEGAEGRMTVRTSADGPKVLDDCYNAGPESMAAALDTLKQMTPGGGGVAVLGDIREVGDYASQLHAALGPKVVETRLRLLVTVGESTPEIVRSAETYAAAHGITMPEVQHFAATAAAAAHIRELVEAEDIVLVKGSRAMEMEHIVAALTGEAVRKAHD